MLPLPCFHASMLPYYHRTYHLGWILQSSERSYRLHRWNTCDLSRALLLRRKRGPRRDAPSSRHASLPAIFRPSPLGNDDGSNAYRKIVLVVVVDVFDVPLIGRLIGMKPKLSASTTRKTLFFMFQTYSRFVKATSRSLNVRYSSTLGDWGRQRSMVRLFCCWNGAANLSKIVA